MVENRRFNDWDDESNNSPERSVGKQILFLEGAQGAGKTTLANLARDLYGDNYVFRGIPTSSFLETHSEDEIWEETSKIAKNAQLNNCNVLVFDRSAISLAAYRIRKFPVQTEAYLQRAVSILNGNVDRSQVSFVLIESEPQYCLDREGRNYSILDSPIEDVKHEIEVYRLVMNRLRKDGFSCIDICNNTTISDLKSAFQNLLNHD